MNGRTMPWVRGFSRSGGQRQKPAKASKPTWRTAIFGAVPHAARGVVADENVTQDAILRYASAILRAVLLLGIIFALTQTRVVAENLGPGGGTRVIAGDEVAGPYRLYVVSSPEPAQIGPVTIVVRITDGKSGEKVKDAEVRVELALPAAGLRLEEAATHGDAASPIDYAVHIPITQAGRYDGLIRVSAAQGMAELRFTQRVLPPRATSTLLILALPFVAGLLILGGLWYFRVGPRAAGIKRPRFS